jgi:rfaE bifunctional protein nucleotidyltransferase chain/domain
MLDEASSKIVSHKIKTAREVAAAVGPRPRNKKVIMCPGTFDIVHPGHIRHLLYAKSKGDVLVASLTGDEHIIKANFRPFVPQELRAFNLAALEMVDYVVIDKDATPINNIGIIKPDYFAKGYEYSKDGLHPRTAVEKEAVEAYGGELLFTPGDIVYSSSGLIETQPPGIATEKLLALLQAEGFDFDGLRTALTKLAVHSHARGGRHDRRQLYPHHPDRRHDQDADHERPFRAPKGLRRRRRYRRQASKGGRRGRYLLDGARRRPARGVCAQGSGGRRCPLPAHY